MTMTIIDRNNPLGQNAEVMTHARDVHVRGKIVVAT